MTAGFETLIVGREGRVLFVDISAPPMNLLGPELVRDLVSLIQSAEADDEVRVLVFDVTDARASMGSTAAAASPGVSTFSIFSTGATKR